MRSPTATKSPVTIEYHEVTREELFEFQRSRPDANDLGARVAAEAVSLMGLARYWRRYAADADFEIGRLRRFADDIKGALRPYNGTSYADMDGRTTSEVIEEVVDALVSLEEWLTNKRAGSSEGTADSPSDPGATPGGHSEVTDTSERKPE